MLVLRALDLDARHDVPVDQNLDVSGLVVPETSVKELEVGCNGVDVPVSRLD